MVMRRLIASVATIALMGALLWSGARRSAPSASTTAPASAAGTTGPAEARVRALLESARDGDIRSYLASFAGPLHDRVAREAGERGELDFAEDLRKAVRARKSHALFAAEPDGDEAAYVTVESVYPDRNERQTFRLELREGSWLVTEVQTIQSHQPKAAFGSAASFIAPEGVPVQGPGLTVETGEALPTARPDDPSGPQND
jgi:hypothetical protein